MTRLLVATNEDLLVAIAGAGGWRTEARLAGSGALCLAADPSRPGLVYCGTDQGGLWRSDDEGGSWQQLADGIAGEQVTAVAVSPDGVVYAGTEPSALHRSEDGGETWRELPGLRALPTAPTWSFPPRPHTSHVRQVLPDLFHPDRLVVCIEAGALVRSLDGGETWIDRVPDGPMDTHTLRAHPLVPDRLCSAAGDGFGRRHGYAMTASGYNESADGGATWQRPDGGLGDLYLWGLAIDAGDPDVMVASASTSPQTAHDPGSASSTVFRRSHDSDWEEVREGLPGPDGCVAAVLAADSAEPGVFYAACNQGLHRSADGGLSWSPLGLDWPDRYRGQRITDLLVLPA